MKTEFPYLVDISLGNYCTFGCPFCYTSSTKRGKFADLNVIERIADMLFQANVFEVVFGGGEPTVYEFKSQYNTTHGLSSVLSKFKEKDFTIGVTTKNYKYHKKKTFDKEMEKIDSLAISCQTIEDLEMATDILAAKKGGTQLYVQTILGCTSWEDFQKFVPKVRELGFYNITLLGYKNYGFGTKVSKHEIPIEWIQLVKESKLHVGVDSILSNEFYTQLVAAGVQPNNLTGKEGESTCYIDALKMVVKPSSFCDTEFPLFQDKTKRLYEYTGRDFIDTYAKF